MVLYKVDNFKFSEEYDHWDGSINVNCSISFFKQKNIEIDGYLENNQPLTKEAYNTLCYLKEHFDIIYENILNALFELQFKDLMRYEIYNENDHSFSPITFNSMEEIHPYLGTPTFEILPNYTKDNYAYFAISFHKDCLLSIEHGLTALFFKNDMMDIQPSDSYCMLQMLMDYEEDCSKWQKDFWLVCFELTKNNLCNLFEEKELVRSKWLKSK
ncbi:hypothetical protein COM11_01525 [Bacillus pseudomycoides]|uniref:DUF6985 domain-containing protein n=1 Tax=Bacillus pseudomycoides TaxID=64104 RepID=UPI000BF6DE08|nr:hypothetical protein [Bacillus pseudomycoides]PGC34495.1 hypothetical protein COM11_01525 [Bacillus pseudomycoides]